MKLKDFMVNSLPRIRGKKKKQPPLDPETGVNSFSDLPEVEVKCQNRLSKSCHAVTNVLDTDWHGNQLYQGLDMMASSHGPSHGMVSSKSAEGFHHLSLMSQSYDARMAVSEYGGSNKIISNTSDSNYFPPGQLFGYQSQQEVHCYLHRHNHQHHHHYHHHHQSRQAKPATVLPQNHSSQIYQKPHRLQTQKSEPAGFFRKSLASFRSIRKPSFRGSKEKDSSKQRQVDPQCALLPNTEISPLQDQNSVFNSTSRKDGSYTDKRPAKPKRRSFKFSKPKDKTEPRPQPDSCDKMCCSDNEVYASASLDPGDTPWPYFSLDRSRSRETKQRDHRLRDSSLDSSNTKLDHNQHSNPIYREALNQTFDSASLSGCESEIPRPKVHRSRSRIKTNPWLPSPQPAMYSDRRSGSCDIHSQQSSLVEYATSSQIMVRSASFESPKRTNLLNDRDKLRERRSLTSGSDQNNPHLNMVKQSENASDNNQTCFTPVSNFDRPRSPMNDLNSEPSKSRPTSLVSPNSEFVMLADNLEQLAQNISFEYEEVLDSTLENISGHNEESAQELFADEDNKNSYGSNESNAENPMIDSDVYSSFDDYSKDCLANACSPDSGVGGLGYAEGDDVEARLQSLGSKDLSDKENRKHFDKTSEMQQDMVKALSRKNKRVDKSNLSDFEASQVDNNQEFFPNEMVISKKSSSQNKMRSRLTNQIESSGDDSFLPLVKSKSRRGRHAEVSRHLDNENSLNYTTALVPKQEYCSNLFRYPKVTNPRDSRAVHQVLQRSSEFTLVNNPSKSNPSYIQNTDKNNDLLGFNRNIDFGSFVESPTDNLRSDRQLAELCYCDDFQKDFLPLQSFSPNGFDIYSSEPVLNSNNQIFSTHLINKDNNLYATPQRPKDAKPPQLFTSEIDLSEMADASCQTEFDSDQHFSDGQSMDSLDRLQHLDPSETTRLWLLTGSMQDSTDTGYSSLSVRDSRNLTDNEEVTTFRDEEIMSSDLGNLQPSLTPSNIQKLSNKIKCPEEGNLITKESSCSNDISEDSQPPPLKPRKTISGLTTNTGNDKMSKMFSNIENQFEEIFQNMFTDAVMTSSTISEAMTSSTNSNISDGSDSTLNGDKANCSILDTSFGSDSLTDSIFVSGNVGHCFPGHIYANVFSESHKQQTSDENSPENSKSTQNIENIDPSEASSPDVCTDINQDMSNGCHDNADYLEFLRDEPLGGEDQKPSVFLVPGIGPVDLSSSTERLNLLSKGSKEPLMTLDDPEAVSLIKKVKALRREKDEVYQQIRKCHESQQPTDQQQRQLHQQRQQELLDSLQGLKKHLEEQSRKLHTQVNQA